MNYRRALIVVTAVAVGVAGCGQEGAPAASGAVITGLGSEILLVNPDSGRENFEMEALFEGTLELSAEKCLIGEDERGREVMLVFPADATFGRGEEPTVQVEGRSLAIGGPVSLGGGALSNEHLDRLAQVAPSGCFRDSTFYVQTIG